MKQINHPKLLALFAVLLFFLSANAQKRSEYKASNGVTYHVGDTITLGRGSDPQGHFRYVVLGGWTKWLPGDNSKGSDQNNMDRTFTGAGAIIKKMRTETLRKVERQIFVVGIGGLTNCDLYVEDALATGELVGPKKAENVAQATVTPASTADELAKFKKLLDQGAISKTEYEAMKKKLLGL